MKERMGTFWQNATSWIERNEGPALVAFLIAYAALLFGVNAELSAGGDNPSYVDPAVNYVMGNGFTSTCWYIQGGNEFWAGNVPLYQFLLIPWFKIWGVSFSAVLWINFLYTVSGAFLVWRACKRSNLIPTAPWRLSAVVFFLLSDSAYYTLTFGRSEPLSFLLIAFVAYSLTLRRTFLRFGCLFGVAFVIPWANLPNITFTAVLGGLLLLFYPKQFWREILAFGLGGAAGSMALLALYKHFGVLDAFFASVMPHLQGGIPGLEAHSKGGITQTFTLRFLAIAVLAVCILDAWQRRPVKFSIFTAACMVCVPLAFLKTGVFPLYYGWYLLFLLVVLVFTWLSRQTRLTRFSWTIVTFLTIAALICPGSFFRRSIKNRLQTIRQGYMQPRAATFAAQVLKPDDVARVDDFFYYEAKHRVRRVFSGSSLYTYFNKFHTYAGEDLELNSVTVCIWRTDMDESFPGFGRLPGQWSATGENLHAWSSTFAVYRRTDSRLR